MTYRSRPSLLSITSALFIGILLLLAMNITSSNAKADVDSNLPGINIGNDFNFTLPYPVAEVSNDLASLNEYKITNLRVAMADYTSAPGIDNTRHFLADALCKNDPNYSWPNNLCSSPNTPFSHFQYGLTYSGKEPLTSTTWADYASKVQQEYDYLAQTPLFKNALAAGMIDFVLGNELEKHIDGTTLSESSLRDNIRTLAATIKADPLWVNGSNLTYSVSSYGEQTDDGTSHYWAIDPKGLGDLDYISVNDYASPKLKFGDNYDFDRIIRELVDVYGPKKVLISEWNMYAPWSDVTNAGLSQYQIDDIIAERLAIIKKYNLRGNYFFTWRFANDEFACMKSDGHLADWCSSPATLLENAARDYYWPWYDANGTGNRDWIMIANPDQATINYQVKTGSSSNQGSLPGGEVVATAFSQVTGGPVDATSLAGNDAIVSQRMLFGNSFEEVPGFETGSLSNYYFWPWYDMQTPGTSDWIMLANPNSLPIYYEISIDGGSGWVTDSGTIAPGGTDMRTFPGTLGGPVVLQAWDSTKKIAENIITSQRVLTNNGTDFNEIGGSPWAAISDRYYWTWYDNSQGNADYIMISNPSSSETALVTIKIGANTYGSYSVPPASTIYKNFNLGAIGPVSLIATKSDEVTPTKVVASQRIIYGSSSSFEEVPGLPASQTIGNVTSLSSEYRWPWYDSTHGSDWVMITNPSLSSNLYYQIFIGGNLVASDGGTPIGPNVTLPKNFNSESGGPVVVKTFADSGHTIPSNSACSQRVLWNGYLNEMWGQVVR